MADINRASKDIHPIIKAELVASDGDTELPSKLTQFICCANCKNLFVWFKIVNPQWVNQSGMSAIKFHLKSTVQMLRKTLWGFLWGYFEYTVGMGIPMGVISEVLWVWVWYGNRKSRPTAALLHLHLFLHCDAAQGCNHNFFHTGEH